MAILPCTNESADHLANLRRLVAGDLGGLFDGPSTVAFDPSLPMISLDLSRVAENSTLISVLMTCSSAWMESALLDPNGGQRWVIYDEAWRLMSHPALLRRMDAHWRLARHYGIANMLIFHKLTDLDNVGDQGSAMRSLANSLLANAETRIVYRQESDQLGPTATALGLTGTITLTGGTAGKGYTVNTALSASTVDASTQLSDLTLRVGEPTDNANYGTVVQAQTVKLGSGDDTLTFDGANYLSGIDTITDAAGTDAGLVAGAPLRRLSGHQHGAGHRRADRRKAGQDDR